MRNATVVISVLLLIGIASAGVCRADQGWTGNVNFTLGAKVLDEDDWEPVEEQGEIGIDVDFRPVAWPVSIVIALLGSYADDDWNIAGDNVDIEGSTSELRFGVRKIWEPSPTMRPYLGGGLALVSAKVELDGPGGSVDDDDQALGFWIGGGIYWTIGNHFNLGFDLGWSKAEVELFGVDAEAGGGHAGLLLGYHW